MSGNKDNKGRYHAQFYIDFKKSIDVFANSVSSLKRKLSKMNVIGSAYIHDTQDPASKTIFYKPRYHQRKENK